MADTFQPAIGSDQSVPTGEDKYDVPPPNYRQIGQAFAAGQADFQATQKTAAPTFGKVLLAAVDDVLKFLAMIVGWALSIVLCVVAFIMRLITSIDDSAAPGMQAIVKNSLGHVFGIGDGPHDRKVGQGVDGNKMGVQISKMITDAIRSGVPASAGKTIQPDDTAANNFIALLARMGVEGWIDGFVAEAIGGGHFASVLELLPIMNEVLGLGRQGRRALAPMMKIFVQDPFTAKLHLDYRPAHLSESAIVRQHLSNRLTPDKLDTALGKQGLSPDNIKELVTQARPDLSDADFEFYVTHGFVSEAQYEDRLLNQGWLHDPRQRQLKLPQQRVFSALAAKRWDIWVEAYTRGDIDDAALTAELSTHSWSPEVKSEMEATARLERDLRPKHLTLGQVETMIKAHVMNIDDLRTWMTRENYPLEEQILLEVWLLGEITSADEAHAAKAAKQKAAAEAAIAKAEKAAADAAAAAAKLEVKGVSVATFESLVESGLRSFDEFTAFLQVQGLQPAAIAALEDLLHHKIAAKEAAAAAHDDVLDRAGEKHLSLSQVEAAVIAGVIPIADLQTFMTQQKFAPADIAIALDYVQGKLDAATAKADAAAAAAAAASVKGISLPNLERAARLGLTTPDDYSAALTAAGFDPHAVELMTGILTAQIAADQDTLAQRAAAAARAATREISLPSLERAVITGLQPMSAYQAQLVALGYDPGDVATLVNLLQLQVDNAHDVAEKKAAAAAKLATKNLSLAEIERAVRLHVLSMDQYRRELADIGFSVEDIGVLSASMLAELTAAAAAAAKQASISNTLGAKGVSLAQEQQLVRAGLSSLDAYTAFLRTQGYSAAVAAQLTQLLADQMAQANLAAAKHEIAAARAAQSNISLADEEKAVVQGIKTLDDFAAFLVDLGFNPVDQATLVALLELRIQPAAVPAA